MFLPSSYIELHSIQGNPHTKQPLKIYIKPDQIVKMDENLVKYKEGENGEGEEKVAVTTRIWVPFCDPCVVQETPEIICKLIVDALNHDITQLQKVQRGLIIAPADALNKINAQATKGGGQIIQ